MVSTTQTQFQIKSQEFIHHIQKHFYDNKPSHICHQLHSRFCKNAVSEVRCTLTFDLTSCYLVDPLIFSLQRRSANIPLKLMSTSQNVAARILTEIWKTKQTKLNIYKVCLYGFWETGKRYLRVYIQIRFRHACHETRDRQSRSLVSGQEEGWGEVKVLLKFWIQLRSMSGLLKKKHKIKFVCSSLNLK